MVKCLCVEVAGVKEGGGGGGGAWNKYLVFGEIGGGVIEIVVTQNKQEGHSGPKSLTWVACEASFI